MEAGAPTNFRARESYHRSVGKSAGLAPVAGDNLRFSMKFVP